MKKYYFKVGAILLTCSTLFSTVTYAGSEKSLDNKEVKMSSQVEKAFEPGLNTNLLKNLASSKYVADTWSGIIPKGTAGKVMQVYTLSRFTIKQKSTIGIEIQQQQTENTSLAKSISYFLVPDSDFSNRIGDARTLLSDYPGMYGQYAYAGWTDVLPGTYVVRVQQGYTPYKTTGKVVITPNN